MTKRHKRWVIFITRVLNQRQQLKTIPAGAKHEQRVNYHDAFCRLNKAKSLFYLH